MMNLTIDDILELFEQRYQYLHHGELIDFKALTFDKGAFFIEFKVDGYVLSEWVTLDDLNIYKRIKKVINLEELVKKSKEQRHQPEYDWGVPLGKELW